LTNKLTIISDGKDALDYIYCEGKYRTRDAEDMPQLMLLDLKLPHVNGMEILRRMKSDERTKKIPVVVITVSRDEQDLNEAYELGANSYIIKPVEFEKFVKAVSEVGYYWAVVNQPPARKKAGVGR
jgi:two-component system response regulator